MSGDSSNKLRAIFLASLMFFWLFAGIMAFAGAATAQEADPDPGQVLALDADGEKIDSFDNIGDAIQKEIDGVEVDTVLVGPNSEEGPYEESITIDVEGLTLEAADGVSPTVTTSSNNGEPTIAVDADDVRIAGLAVVRTGSSDLVAQAVRVAGSDVTLADNTYEATGNNDAAVAVLTDSSGAAGNPDVSDETFDNIEITGGEISDSPTGVLVADNGDASFADGAVSITDVSFTDNDFQVIGLDTGGSVVDGAAVLNDNTFDTAALPDATDDEDSIDTVITSDIQSAVDTAAADATVNVADGTYEQSVTIDTEGLTLEGPNAEAAGDSDQRGEEATITDDNGRLVIEASNVEINGFNFEFDESAIQSKSGNDNLITNSRFELTGDTSDTYAIRVGGGSPGTDVTNNLFTNIVSGDGTEGNNVNGVVVTDPRDTRVADNVFSSVDTGVNIGNGDSKADTLVIEGNEFSDITQLGAVALNNGDSTLDADVKNNIIQSSSIGVGVYADNTESEIDITNNNIIDVDTGLDASNVKNTVDATSNWWGAPSGPSGETGSSDLQPTGEGAAVSGPVEFAPWLNGPFNADGTTQVQAQGVSLGESDSATAEFTEGPVSEVSVERQNGFSGPSFTIATRNPGPNEEVPTETPLAVVDITQTGLQEVSVSQTEEDPSGYILEFKISQQRLADAGVEAAALASDAAAEYPIVLRDGSSLSITDIQASDGEAIITAETPGFSEFVIGAERGLGISEFDVNITEAPTEVAPGESFDVQYTVENVGEEPARQGVELAIADETVATKPDTLTAGQRVTNSFTDVQLPAGVNSGTSVNLAVRTEDNSNTTVLTVGDGSGTTPAPVGDYANADGNVETDGLVTAIGDWRGGTLETDALLEVISAWRAT